MKQLKSNKIPTSYPQSVKLSEWNDVITISDNSIVLFNTLSRSALLLTHAEYDQIASLSSPDKALLLELGFLVDSSLDEKAALEQRFISGKQDMSYIDLTILLTHNCQFRCVYCFEGEKENINIDDATIAQIIQFLTTQLHVCKKLRVTWFGGEPLLAYHQLKNMSLQLLDFCRTHHIEYTADITTNGYALTPSRCREIVNDLHVDRHIITLDGPAEIHNIRRPLCTGKPSFERIWENIASLVQEGAKVMLRMTIDKDNAPHIPTLLDEIAQSSFAGKVGISFCRTIDCNFTPDSIKSKIFSESEFAALEWELIQYAHTLGLWQYSFPYAAPTGGCLRDGDIVIGARGEIYKCLDTVGDKQWICGSIGELSLSARPQWYEDWLLWTPSKSSACKVCVLQPLCNGGCPHNALFTDKKHGTTTQCPDWKANYKNQIIALVKELENEKAL